MKPDNNRQNNGQNNKPHSEIEPDIEPDMTPALQAFAPLCSVFRRFLKSQDLKYTQESADVLDAIISRDDAFEAEELLLDLRSRGHGVSHAAAVDGRGHHHPVAV